MKTDECKSVGIKDLVAGHPGIARGPWNGIGTLSVVETRATKRTEPARKFVSSGIGAVQRSIGIHSDVKRIILFKTRRDSALIHGDGVAAFRREDRVEFPPANRFADEACLVLELRQEEHFVEDEDMRPVDGGIAAVRANVLNVREAALAASAVGGVLFEIGYRVRPGIGCVYVGEVRELRAELHLKRMIVRVAVAAEIVDAAKVGRRTQRINARFGISAIRRVGASGRIERSTGLASGTYWANCAYTEP